MINKLLLYFLLFVPSLCCFALPTNYVYRSYGTSGSMNGTSSLVLFLSGVFGFFLYYKELMDWVNRKRNQLEPDLGFGMGIAIGEWLFILLIYAFISLFASLLIFLMLDAIWGGELIRSIGLYVWLVLFIILLVLAMT